MTAASAARRARRLNRSSATRLPDGCVLIDKPPLFVDLRPMTIDDLDPGETWQPGMTILELRRCDEQGNRLPPRKMKLSLPSDLRANTHANLVEIFRRFRRIAPDIQESIDSYALFFPKTGGPVDGRPMWEARTVPG
ncbi:hypothetical protein [Mesorhizobium marinum]|uniref:hypothetical protein n=1 Tax=Mesorhizobium marinum TaxID=3228790 RepID=UPI003466C593